MPAANALAGLGLDGDVYLETGNMLGGSPYDGPGAVDAITGPPTAEYDRSTSVKVALIAMLAVGFIVMLRRNGFRDMVAQ